MDCNYRQKMISVIFKKRRGLAEIPLLIGLLIMAIAVPVATKLVQNNQDTRNLAASCGGSYQQCCTGQVCNSGFTCLPATGGYFCVPNNLVTNTPRPQATATPIPATRTCTWRTCETTTCRTHTGEIDYDENCPISNCTSDANCHLITPTPLPTVSQCIPDNMCVVSGLRCCHASKTVPTYTCASGYECVAVAPTATPTNTPVPVRKCYCSASCGSASASCQMLFNVQSPYYVECANSYCAMTPTPTPTCLAPGVRCDYGSGSSITPYDACHSRCCSHLYSLQYNGTYTCDLAPTATPTITCIQPNGTCTTGNKCCGSNVCRQDGEFSDRWACLPPTTPTATRTPTPTMVKSCYVDFGGRCAYNTTSCNANETKVTTTTTCSQQGNNVCCKPNASPTPIPTGSVLTCGVGNGGVCALLDEGKSKCSGGKQYFCDGSCWDFVKDCGTAGCGTTTCRVPTATPTSGGGVIKPPVSTPTPVTNCSVINGVKVGDIWISLADENSAKCICGVGNYYANGGKWYCGKQPVGTAVPQPTNTISPINTISPVNTIPPTTTCKECPTTFRCYNNGKEYKWFVNGYVMAGFSLTPASQMEPCGARPTFKGKGKGDANCDGFIDVTDFSQWYKEYFDGNKGVVSKLTWEADFTGTDGKCDQKVDVFDYSLWYKFFTELKGGN